MGAPKYLSFDHDPMFTYHQWASSLGILDFDEVKRIPNTPYSHPVIERLNGTIQRDRPNQTLFWNGEVNTVFNRFKQNPFQVIIYIAISLFILYVSIKPFVNFGD
jgi:hypothetical protein